MEEPGSLENQSDYSMKLDPQTLLLRVPEPQSWARNAEQKPKGDGGGSFIPGFRDLESLLIGEEFPTGWGWVGVESASHQHTNVQPTPA